jgi:WD40 repeat protein
VFKLELGLPRRLNSLAFSPDGSRLAACGEKGAVKLWGLEKRAEEKCPLTGRKSNDAVFFGPDGQELFVLPRGTGLLGKLVARGKWQCRSFQAIAALAPLPGGRVLCHTLATTSEGGRLVLLNIDDFKAVWSRPLLGKRGIGFYPEAVGCSGDGTVLLCAGAICVVRFDAHSGAEVSRWDNPLTATVTDLAVSPTGHAAALCAASTLFFQRVTPEEAQVAHRVGKTHFMAAAWHPSGDFFATANGDGKVDYWDGRTGQHRESFDWKTGKLLDVAFDQTGDRAAACSELGEVVVWDVDR